ncbi:unnamed protein product [Phyllotreta striolata]|uniref:HSF-type DNA-binding domain-containing protein n=1 Tax=Phyllotreta striolata TaxID=444603 RepID=A0A9N9TLX0_PHYSR|nr:unnamed protein product [Phyllotreta striolata]
MEEGIEQEEQPQITTANSNVPLFIKKLWKMVNDKDAEDIISWNATGDSFIIHNQLEFITTLLPLYFKHNNMASFVRQLNFYNFHKVPNIKDEIQFTHTCFMKDVPEILPFIRRKNPILNKKTISHHKEQEVEELLTDIKNLKSKHTLVDKELAMLKQENVALWNELNSLRLKYTKQSTIINMLIHFLITYIHSHQNSFTTPNIQVSPSENIKVGPTLLEIGYKNNKSPTKNNADHYTVLEPGTSSSITYSVKLPKSDPETQRPRKNAHTLEDLLAMEDQGYPSLKRAKKRPLTYSIKLPGNQPDKLSKPEIQNSLMDILRENELLCEEDTDDILKQHVREAGLLNDEVNEESPIVNSPEETPTYTISYPNETTVDWDHPPTLNTQLIKLEQINNDYNLSTVPTVPTVPTEPTVPIVPTSPTVSTPKDGHQIKQETVGADGKSSSKYKFITKPKFIKIPIKNLNQSSANKTNFIKVSPNQAAKQASVKQNVASPKNVNAEGALLEILKETEKLKEDNMNLPASSNMQNLLNSPSVEETFPDLYTSQSDVASSDFEAKSRPNLNRTRSISKEKQFNIMDNPKEHLSQYVDSTQEEIDMLQDILNDLTSKDITEILNTDPQEGDGNVETEGENAEEYVNIDDSVDKYFKNSLWNLENSQ